MLNFVFKTTCSQPLFCKEKTATFRKFAIFCIDCSHNFQKKPFAKPTRFHAEKLWQRLEEVATTLGLHQKLVQLSRLKFDKNTADITNILNISYTLEFRNPNSWRKIEVWWILLQMFFSNMLRTNKQYPKSPINRSVTSKIQVSKDLPNNDINHHFVI